VTIVCFRILVAAIAVNRDNYAKGGDLWHVIERTCVFVTKLRVMRDVIDGQSFRI